EFGRLQVARAAGHTADDVAVRRGQQVGRYVTVVQRRGCDAHLAAGNRSRSAHDDRNALEPTRDGAGRGQWGGVVLVAVQRAAAAADRGEAIACGRHQSEGHRVTVIHAGRVGGDLASFHGRNADRDGDALEARCDRAITRSRGGGEEGAV